MKNIFGKAMLLSIVVAGLLKIIQKLFNLEYTFLYHLQIFVLAISLLAALMLMFTIYLKNKFKNNQSEVCDKLN